MVSCHHPPDASENNLLQKPKKQNQNPKKENQEEKRYCHTIWPAENGTKARRNTSRMRRRIRRGGELLSLAMAITPGSGHCSSLCTQELEMKPKHSSGLRILLLLPRLPQAPLLLLPLARSPQSCCCCCAQDGASGSVVYHAFVVPVFLAF